MSQEAAKVLIEKMKTNKEFRDKILSVEDPNERMNIIKQEGLEVTKEEIRQQSQQLSDQDLDNVAGGDCFTATPKEIGEAWFGMEFECASKELFGP